MVYISSLEIRVSLGSYLSLVAGVRLSPCVGLARPCVSLARPFVSLGRPCASLSLGAHVSLGPYVREGTLVILGIAPA